MQQDSDIPKIPQPERPRAAPDSGRQSTAPPNMEPHARLLRSMVRELFQTERSAERHPEREARRFRGTPPGDALHAVSIHAAQVLRELPELARDQDLPDSWSGRTIGSLFSTVRQMVVDRLIDAERSYRATLLGLRHGVDLVKLIRHVADGSGRVEIGGFCTRWLAEREPLIAEVEVAMRWFAEHPKVAAAYPSWGAGLRALRGNGENRGSMPEEPSQHREPTTAS